MKSTPLIVNWHDASAPVYSAHFEPNGKRLATGGGDNNVRLWRIDAQGEDRTVEYLSTLSKHSQAVNVVRFAPKGELLASAGDDGNVLLWIPSETHNAQATFGSDSLEDKETWRVKHMCRSSGAEIYDLSWSPDAIYFIIGSMDNIARIYNAQTGQLIRQIAEHSHYVQGVAWDPLNEYVATQSSDRSVHIYSLRTKDGHFTLENGPARIASHQKMDLPGRRISSNSPAPPEFGLRHQTSEPSNLAVASPAPSTPGTPQVLALPMNPPSSISRRSSFGSTQSMRRSVSPAPSMPLPAVMPMEASPKPHPGHGMRNSNLYANETLTSFFRRLTFTPDGGLLLTPAGQYSIQHSGKGEGGKPTFEVINTVYIYTRGGINKPPIAHLPGHKKPSVVVKCSPVLYTIRKGKIETKSITIDTSSLDDSIPALPASIVAKEESSSHDMEPPPLTPSINDLTGPTSTPRQSESDFGAAAAGPNMAFSLPYRIIYAVATQDSVLLYDTQQQTPICIVSNLHCATFTDLTWSNDGLTLLMTSSDGFCSTLTFSPDELGQVYTSEVPSFTPGAGSVPLSSQNTPVPTPTSSVGPSFPPIHQRTTSNSAIPTNASAPSPPPIIRPYSPTRSNSTSSIATQSSFAPPTAGAPHTTVISNPPLVSGTVPGITASSGIVGGMALNTPPQTPHSAVDGLSGVKRGTAVADGDEQGEDANKDKPVKKRRIAPTPVEGGQRI